MRAPTTVKVLCEDLEQMRKHLHGRYGARHRELVAAAIDAILELSLRLHEETTGVKPAVRNKVTIVKVDEPDVRGLDVVMASDGEVTYQRPIDPLPVNSRGVGFEG